MLARKGTIRNSSHSIAKVLSLNRERSCWKQSQGEGGSLDLISVKKGGGGEGLGEEGEGEEKKLSH